MGYQIMVIEMLYTLLILGVLITFGTPKSDEFFKTFMKKKNNTNALTSESDVIDITSITVEEESSNKKRKKRQTAVAHRKEVVWFCPARSYVDICKPRKQRATSLSQRTPIPHASFVGEDINSSQSAWTGQRRRRRVIENKGRPNLSDLSQDSSIEATVHNTLETFRRVDYMLFALINVVYVSLVKAL